MDRYVLGFICLQGGGLLIHGKAKLTNTNIYANTASQVRARLLNLPRAFLHRPTGYAHCLRCAVAGRSEFSRQIEPLHVTFHPGSCKSNPRVTFHRPIELTLELTDCCARARDFGIAVCECLHFEPSLTCPPSPR